jgi:hypothetical protein
MAAVAIVRVSHRLPSGAKQDSRTRARTVMRQRRNMNEPWHGINVHWRGSRTLCAASAPNLPGDDDRARAALQRALDASSAPPLSGEVGIFDLTHGFAHANGML